MSGTAIASPVMNIIWTFSRSTISQVRTGSNLGSRMVTWPAKRCMSSDAWAPPCISGLSGRVMSPSPAACLDWSYSSSGTPVMKSMPPPSTRQKSSWRHITPLGKPVVPPV